MIIPVIGQDRRFIHTFGANAELTYEDVDLDLVARGKALYVGGYLGRKTLFWMYETILKIRRFEEELHLLFLQGELPGTLHLYVGQEAVATGVCAHLR